MSLSVAHRVFYSTDRPAKTAVKVPTRYLKPGIRDSDRIEAIESPDAEILYYRLLVSVDDFGRADARPLMVKSLCFPIRQRATADKCMQWLQELETARLIALYESDGKPYLQLTKWDNKPRAECSKYPEPPTDADKRMQMLPVTVTETVTKTENREPSTLADARVAKPAVPPCPHREIIESYHRHFPMGQKVNPALWDGTRALHLQARWREDASRQSVGWWDTHLAYCATSRFLTGQVPSRHPGEAPFRVSLDFLVQRGNFVKCLEGHFHRELKDGPRKVAL